MSPSVWQGAASLADGVAGIPGNVAG